MTLRDQILQTDDLPTEAIHVPEWAVTVYLRSMTGTERDAFEASLFVEGKGGNRQQNLKNLRARLAAKTMVDEVGERLFADKEADISALGAKSSKALDRIFQRAQEINGMRDEDVEEMVGNSEADGADSS